MKRFSKIIPLVLIMIMCFTVSVFAAETEYDLSVDGDGSVIAVFDDETGVLTISGSGATADYTTGSSGSPLYSILSSVKEVIVEEGVTTLGDYVFFSSTSNCLSNCTTVSLPSTLTSIGDKNFYFAPYVSNFSCLGDISDFGVEFLGATTSTSSQMGSKASAKTATVNANDIYLKEALEGLGYTVSTVGQTTISATESYPSSNILPLGTPTSTDVMGYYNEYSKVFKIEGTGAIKDGNGYGILGSTYYKQVTEVIVGEGITSLGKSAFYTSTLKSISLPSTLTSIGDYAFYCSSLESITIPANVESIGDSAFKTTNNLTTVTFEEGSKLESIDYAAFSNASALTAIEIPESVTSIGDYAFNQCTALKDFVCLSYPLELGANTFTNMGRNATAKVATVSANNVFLKEALESLGYTVSTSGAQTVDKYASYPTAFALEVGASGDNIIAYVNPYFGSLDLKGSGATKDYDCSAAYYAKNSPISGYLTNITTLTIDEGITYLGKNLFHGTSSYLSKVTSVELPSTLTEIGESTFYNLGASTITIPTNVETIGVGAFRLADLSSITFENGSKLKTIGEEAFRDAEITSIKIPDGVTSIGRYAFSGCYYLTYISIPESVETLGEAAFSRFGERATESTVVRNYGGATQTIGTKAFYQNSSQVSYAPTIYQYRANTAMTTALSESSVTPAAVYYFDDIELSGTLENGIRWTYDPDSKTLSFEGDGDIPDYVDGGQPWYGAASQHGGVGTYMFSDGITGIGTGIFGSYGGSGGSNGSGSVIYGPSGLNYSGAGGGGATYGGSSGGSTTPDTSGSDENTMIIVDAEPTNFLVTVPIRIDVEMDKNGNISTGSGYYVENECAMGPIIITDVKVVAETEWSLVDWNSDFHNMKASSKVIGLTINGVEVGANGSVVMNESLSSVIRNKESKELFFGARLSAQKRTLEANVAAVVFTVDFDKV